MEPKSTSPAQCIKQYPGEQLDTSAGKLFCKACREEPSLKGSSIANHVKSAKHVDGKRGWQVSKHVNKTQQESCLSTMSRLT